MSTVNQRTKTFRGMLSGQTHYILSVNCVTPTGISGAGRPLVGRGGFQQENVVEDSCCCKVSHKISLLRAIIVALRLE